MTGVSGARSTTDRGPMAMERQGGDPRGWWGEIDGEILHCLSGHGTMTLGDVCGALGISEGEATSFLAMLAREGKVRICQVELAAGPENGRQVEL